MSLVKKLLPFFSVSLLFIITGLILVLITDKHLLHLSINAMVGGSWDRFFALYTYIGDGVTVPVIVVLASLFKKKDFLKYLTLGITAFAISGLLAQFFKRLIFPEMMRPVAVFGEHNLTLVDGVNLHGQYSFPSGHSTVSFALFVFLAFCFHKYRWVQILFAVLAILAAFSRVYLSQHFIEDIVAGALLGLLSFLLIYWLYDKYIFKRNRNKRSNQMTN